MELPKRVLQKSVTRPKFIVRMRIRVDTLKTDPILLVLARQVSIKLCAALASAALLIFGTNGSIEQGFRYLSAICLLVSIWLIAMAIIRHRPLRGALSEWDEELIFSSAHFLAVLLT